MNDECKHVECKENQKKYEEFVVAVANAVVDKCAVVVESLDAFIAIVTVPCFFWSQILALDAHIV